MYCVWQLAVGHQVAGRVDNWCYADPLRVLRGIRFASRYAFTMAEGLRSAVESDEVRNRVGTPCACHQVTTIATMTGLRRCINVHA